jgi:hypothetical protein
MWDLLFFSIRTHRYSLFRPNISPQLGILRSGDKVDPLSRKHLELGVKRTGEMADCPLRLPFMRILRTMDLCDPQNHAQRAI